MNPTQSKRINIPYKGQLFKGLLLSLVSTLVFATAIDHIHFTSNTSATIRGGEDFIFANSFEEGTTTTYTSDPVVEITDIPSIEIGSELVGSIGGAFQTDQMGQANYSIPILTGAGSAGLAPQVSLNYSSGSGNGPLGVGWSLSGTTIITRCRDTQESRDTTVEITPQPIM